jgi:predicted cupin superfamily sugar epimerase
MNSIAQAVIDKLGLEPHPNEGGYFVETYRSKERIPADGLPDRYEGERNFSTAIYYLLTPDTFSEFHRLPTDEIFHFYAGDPVTQVHLRPSGEMAMFTLGPNVLEGEIPQLVVPAGVWQGSFLNPGGQYALLGATVAPGFDFEDYESGPRNLLLSQFPALEEFILKLTHP